MSAAARWLVKQRRRRDPERRAAEEVHEIYERRGAGQTLPLRLHRTAGERPRCQAISLDLLMMCDEQPVAEEVMRAM